MKKIVIPILLGLLVFCGSDAMAQKTRGNRNAPAGNNNATQPSEPSYFIGVVSYRVDGAENIKLEEAAAPSVVIDESPALDVNAPNRNAANSRVGKERKDNTAEFYYLEDAFYGNIVNVIALYSQKDIHLRYGLFRDAVKVFFSEQDCLEEFYSNFEMEHAFKRVGTTKKIAGRTATLYVSKLPDIEAEFWVDETTLVHQNCGLFFGMRYLVLECDLNIIVATGTIHKFHLVAKSVKDSVVDKRPIEGMLMPEYVPINEIIDRLTQMMK